MSDPLEPSEWQPLPGGPPTWQYRRTGAYVEFRAAPSIEDLLPRQVYVELATKLLAHPDVVHAMAIRLQEEGL